MQTRLRLATEQDAPAIRAIYAPYCADTVTSFETVAPTVDEIRARIRHLTPQYPWLVGERAGHVSGYAYASPHRERAAYRWSVDVAIYIAPGHQRTGLGRALYTALIKILIQQGYHQACAGITLPNPASVGLHETLGFKPIGIYRHIGYKHGAWRDVGWWQLTLQPEHPNPPEPIPIRTLQTTPHWQHTINSP